jgi:hypothetical protein
MTEPKLQCYIKSVTSDITHLKTELMPIFQAAALVGGVLIGGILVLYAVWLFGEFVLTPGLKYLIDAAVPIYPYLSQFNIVITCLIVVDSVIFYEVWDSYTHPTSNQVDRDILSQLFLASILLGMLAFFNIFFTYAAHNSPGEQYAGWSFMLLGIFLIRAYIRCEHPVEQPADPEEPGLSLYESGLV